MIWLVFGLFFLIAVLACVCHELHSRWQGAVNQTMSSDAAYLFLKGQFTEINAELTNQTRLAEDRARVIEDYLVKIENQAESLRQYQQQLAAVRESLSKRQKEVVDLESELDAKDAKIKELMLPKRS